MKKYLSVLILVVLCLIPVLASASVAYPGVVQVRDSSGQLIPTYLHGDEYFSYTTDTSGHLLIRDGFGSFRYVVTPDGNSLAEGDLVVTDPRLRLRGSAGEGLLANDVTDLRGKLSALMTEIAASTPMPYANDPFDPQPIPADYNYNDPSIPDPMNGHWLSEDAYVKPDSPLRESTCSLLIIKVEFEDVQCLFTDTEWNQRIFGAGGVSDYYTEVSNGNFTYKPASESSGVPNDGVVTVKLPIKRPVFEPIGFTNQNFDRGAHTGMYPGKDGKMYAIFNDSSIFAYALLAAESVVDFDAYDRNHDTYISPTELAVLTVPAGYEAAYVGDMGATAPMTWAHSWHANTYMYYAEEQGAWGWPGGVKADNVYLYKYTTIGENLNGDYDYSKKPNEQAPGVERLQAPIGTPCHELGHDLGLMDLYPTNRGETTQTREVAFLSLMAGGNWGSKEGEPAGSSPTHLDPYSKAFLHFYDPVTVGTGGAYPLAQSADAAEYRILRVNTQDPNQYYLIENRAFSSFDAGLQAGLEGPAGLVCWRINDAVVRENWDTNSVNSTPDQYGVMPEYVYYLNYYENQPFRSSLTHSTEPFLLLGSSGLSFSSPEESAARMNAWLSPLKLAMSLSAYTFQNAPDELLAVLDTEAELSPSDLQDVQVDEQVLQPEQCQIRQGSIIMAFQKAYLDTLAPGAHVVRATLKNGLTAEAPFTVATPPAPADVVPPHTGDPAAPMLWLGLVALSLAGLCLLAMDRKRKTNPS